MERRKNYLALCSYSLLGVCIFIFLCMHTPSVGFDTVGYIHFSPMRPPLYPIFIELFKWAGRYQLDMVMWTQTVLICASLMYARVWLKRHLFISDVFIFSAYIIITIHLFFGLALLTSIMSEGLAFPLFVVAFFTLLDCFLAYQTKKLLWLGVLTTLLILTRVQFYFFYLAFVLLLIWYAGRKVSFKKIAVAALIFLASILCTVVAVRSYNFILRGSFSGTISTLGEQLIVQPLYLTNINAEKYFTDPAQKKYVHDVMKDMSQNDLGNVIPNPALSLGLHADYEKANPRFSQAVTAMRYSDHHGGTSFWGPPIPTRDLLYDYYTNNYNAIMLVAKAHTPLMSTQAADQFRTHVSLILFLHEFKKNVVFFILKWINFTGGILLTLTLITVLLVACVRIITKKSAQGSAGEVTHIFVAVGIILIFINNAEVAVVEALVLRYLFYSYFIFYCLVALIMDRLFIAKAA